MCDVSDGCGQVKTQVDYTRTQQQTRNLAEYISSGAGTHNAKQCGKVGRIQGPCAAQAKAPLCRLYGLTRVLGSLFSGHHGLDLTEEQSSEADSRYILHKSEEKAVKKGSGGAGSRPGDAMTTRGQKL